MVIIVKDANGVSQTVETSNPNGRAAATGSKPVTLSTEDFANLTAMVTELGATTETAPASDVAASGLNGRLQRLAQRTSSLISLFPSSIGQKVQANSLSVTLASDQPAIAVSGPLTDAALRATPLTVTGPLTDAALRASPVPVSGSVAVTGTVATSLASLPSLAAGSAIVGKLGIDQTTDGTTNKVNIDASLKSTSVVRTTVASVTTSVTIVASNAARKGATIYNNDANALLIDLSGGAASSARCQVRLTQYQSYEVGSGFTGAITGIWEADGSGQADIVEFS